MSAHDVVVVAYARTPFGRFEDQLAALDGPTLGALAIDETLRRSGLAARAVEAVYGGVGMIGSAVLTPVRQAVLRSALPETTPSAAIDRACCSGTSTPATAIRKVAQRQDRGPADWDLIEINEAYAATPLVSTLTLTDGGTGVAAICGGFGQGDALMVEVR